MKELKFLLSINLSLILLVGAIFPVTALAEEIPADKPMETEFSVEEECFSSNNLRESQASVLSGTEGMDEASISSKAEIADEKRNCNTI